MAFLTKGKFTFWPHTVYSYGHKKACNFRILPDKVSFKKFEGKILALSDQGGYFQIIFMNNGVKKSF